MRDEKVWFLWRTGESDWFGQNRSGYGERWPHLTELSACGVEFDLDWKSRREPLKAFYRYTASPGNRKGRGDDFPTTFSDAGGLGCSLQGTFGRAAAEANHLPGPCEPRPGEFASWPLQDVLTQPFPLAMSCFS